jgi:hypothetical protein
MFNNSTIVFLLLLLVLNQGMLLNFFFLTQQPKQLQGTRDYYTATEPKPFLAFSFSGQT